MEHLIDETMDIASQHFKNFGFQDEQIVPLLESGKRDLTKELNKLQELLEKEVMEIHSINLSVHALKGLFLTMGNVTVGEKLSEIHHKSEDARSINEIKNLLSLT
jgi:hypothetical protein